MTACPRRKRRSVSDASLGGRGRSRGRKPEARENANARSVENAAIPGECACAVIDSINHIALSNNRNPHLAWSEVPDGTESFVVICHDYDVPSRGDDVNREGREVPATLPRIDFFHWVLMDIPAATREIDVASHSDGVTPHGKSGPDAPGGMRHGLNDYTTWFNCDPNMRGDYYGYDGAGPPWNDALLHHYVFTVYALDVPRLAVPGDLTGSNVRTALAGHVLAEATLTGTYTLNPRATKLKIPTSGNRLRGAQRRFFFIADAPSHRACAPLVREESECSWAPNKPPNASRSSLRRKHPGWAEWAFRRIECYGNLPVTRTRRHQALTR